MIRNKIRSRLRWDSWQSQGSQYCDACFIHSYWKDFPRLFCLIFYLLLLSSNKNANFSSNLCWTPSVLFYSHPNLPFFLILNLSSCSLFGLSEHFLTISYASSCISSDCMTFVRFSIVSVKALYRSYSLYYQLANQLHLLDCPWLCCPSIHTLAQVLMPPFLFSLSCIIFGMLFILDFRRDWQTWCFSFILPCPWPIFVKEPTLRQGY